MLKGAVRILHDLVAPANPAFREYAKLDIMRFIGRFIAPKYRFEWPMLDWWNDAKFNGYLERFGISDSLVTRNRWMVNELLKLIESVPGDTAECGVFEGATSYLICNARGKFSRTHHIFDSFEGLSQPGNRDGNAGWQKGMLACSVEQTKSNLPFPNVTYHKGWIPDRFNEVIDRNFAFVHIDVDLYQPTFDSIAFFYPRVNSGGLIVCDDYGYSGCPGATQAINEFMSDKPEKIISPPCGGAFIIRASTTESIQPAKNSA
jgi:O-methyltransferase